MQLQIEVMPIIKVIIPAFNEEDSIKHVINDIPDIVDEVIVVSNNSTENTEKNAKVQVPQCWSKHKKGMVMLVSKAWITLLNKKKKQVSLFF